MRGIDRAIVLGIVGFGGIFAIGGLAAFERLAMGRRSKSTRGGVRSLPALVYAGRTPGLTLTVLPH